MDLSNNQRIVHRRAARDLALKIQLEGRLKPSLKRFLREINEQFRIKYKQNNQQEIINVDEFMPELIGILRQHYRRVSLAFAGVERTELKGLQFKAVDEEVRLINEAVRASMSEFIFIESENHARIILKTVKDELDEAILKVINDSIAAGKEPAASEIADLVYQDFARKVNGKVDTISITETQFIAEKTKEIEYQQIAGDPTADIFLKQWVSILDGRTRPWHAAADGQRVAINQPFIVKGERLMYPGDSHFGASLNNIINCRCSHLLVKMVEDDSDESVIIQKSLYLERLISGLLGAPFERHL
jgi:hypothetical protein